MSVTCNRDRGQAMLWNGPAARGWVEMQGVLDEMFRPFENLLADAASVANGAGVLDVGCGAGSTTLAVARKFGEGGSCVGIDISEPLIGAANIRAGREKIPARFINADAQSHAFAPATFDRIISRFGVMFFDDPVDAFANLRRAARDDADLHFIAWRGADENPFMTAAERAAAPLLPNLAPRQRDAPGQFAFADPHRVRSLLKKSGWGEIDIQPLDVGCVLPRAELTRYVASLGPVGLLLQQVDEPLRTKVLDAACAAFTPFVHDAEVRYDAACWVVRARALSSSAYSAMSFRGIKPSP